MLQGLRKIDGSRNYYSSEDGRVFSVKEIKPYRKGSKNYYQIISEDGSKIYYQMEVVKTTTNNTKATAVVKTTTERTTTPVVKSTTPEEVANLIF